MQFQWNFTGLICSSSPCAYCTGFPVEWFLAELWPFDKKVFFFCVLPDTQKLVGTTPHKLLVQFYPNFIGMISTKSSCALSVCLSVCHKVYPNMKLAIMRRHMWLLIALVYFQQATLNTVVMFEVILWFFVGECIGKRSYVGYPVKVPNAVHKEISYT
jgi:hypothetical protein